MIQTDAIIEALPEQTETGQGKTAPSKPTVFLPELQRTIYKLGGNYVVQHIASSLDIEVNIIDSGRYHSIIEHDGLRFYLTTKAENIPDDIQRALLTNVIPTKSQFDKGNVRVKSWIKHPQLKHYSPSDINTSWRNNFNYIEEDLSINQLGLRQPQLSALHSILGNLKIQTEAATVVMPTGTGKTETMLSILIASRSNRLLVTVPSDSLREQISEKFVKLGLLKKFKIVNDDALFPIVGVIKSKFKSPSDLKNFFENCNVIISTMSWLTSQSKDDQTTIAQLCSNIFIDEAHHVKAVSWNDFANKFPKEKIIQFTATPFRNDGKRLDGKIISNFPLRKAQEQGYYKQIKFVPIREYDSSLADKMIAETAVKLLRKDISNGYNHILMARCATKSRAEEIYKLYQRESDLNPVLLYSGSPDFKNSYQKIILKTSKIIVCVDMLGEGFDLPELKVAAFHDIRRSLPITLQFAGRFTRTKYDENLGEASFIANIADLEVRAELADLYAEDADWNEILSDTSYERINEQVEFKDFLDGFDTLKKSNIPFQNIKPKLSTVVYKNKTSSWFPNNFAKGITGYEELDFKFSDLNRHQKMLVIITGRKLDVEWVHHREIHDVVWDIIIVFWDTKNNLLFINSSDNGSLYQELAQAIIGPDAELIRGINVFKSFYNLKRVRLQNVGLRQFLGKNIRFRMMVGSDVGEALTLAERQRGEKAFVMGTGFETGNPVNIGASYKGRIWTKLKGDLKNYKQWCIDLGAKLIDNTIDPNQILKETLIPALVTSVPYIQPVWIDWDVDMYLETESKFRFIINGRKYDLSTVEICLEDPKLGGPLKFAVNTGDSKAIFEINLFEDKSTDDAYADFRIIKITPEDVQVQNGTRSYTGVEFFSRFIPTVWFADGSALTGNEFVELKQSIPLYPKDSIVEWNWSGVNLNSESQHVSPKITDSIQYKVIQVLKGRDFDIIYDDDYSGEIADIVAIKHLPDKVVVSMYHLKYATGGIVSSQIKNFYEVCGQAQKSMHWKHKGGKEFINHLLKRQIKSRNGQTCDRLEKGTKADLIRLLSVLKNEIPVEYRIIIIQPGVSRITASNEILTLLGVTDTYIKEFADINLEVIGST